MDSKRAENLIKNLSEKIIKHSHLYHTLDAPKISDSEYDKLFKQLIELEQEFPDLVDQSSPTQRVGSRPMEGFKKIEHRAPMLSLENAFSSEEFEEFDKRIKERLAINLQDPLIYSCEPKLDGVAVNLFYQDGTLLYASTRGDGKVGEDITHNIKTIKSIPLQLVKNKSYPEKIEIRGEVFIEKNGFIYFIA